MALGGAKEVAEAPRTRSTWQPILGWALIFVAVVGGGTQLSDKTLTQNLLGILQPMAFMIVLGVGFVLRWPRAWIVVTALTLACILALSFIPYLVPSPGHLPQAPAR
jgi:hypothetical protein